MKRINSKVCILLAVIMMLTMAFVACTQKTEDPTTPKETGKKAADATEKPAEPEVEKVFNTVLGGNPTVLDPIIFRDANANSIIIATHEPLVRFDESGLGYEPGLAEKVEHNADSTVWTFTLREGAMWSDGTPVTTEDIVFSFQRALHPEMGSPNV